MTSGAKINPPQHNRAIFFSLSFVTHLYVLQLQHIFYLSRSKTARHMVQNFHNFLINAVCKFFNCNMSSTFNLCHSNYIILPLVFLNVSLLLVKWKALKYWCRASGSCFCNPLEIWGTLFSSKIQCSASSLSQHIPHTRRNKLKDTQSQSLTFIRSLVQHK